MKRLPRLGRLVWAEYVVVLGLVRLRVVGVDVVVGLVVDSGVAVSATSPS